MKTIDLIAGLYIAFAVWRGRARGLPIEGYRLFRLLVAFGAGCGLYGLISQILERVLSMGGAMSGTLSFALTFAGAWFFLRLLKRSIIAFLTARFPHYTKLGGALAGGARALILVVGLVGLLHISGRGEGRDRERSMIGRIAGWVIPGE